jgi:hypothetical protein
VDRVFVYKFSRPDLVIVFDRIHVPAQGLRDLRPGRTVVAEAHRAPPHPVYVEDAKTLCLVESIVFVPVILHNPSDIAAHVFFT